MEPLLYFTTHLNSNSIPHRVGGERKHSGKTEIRHTTGEEIYKPEMTQLPD